MSLDSDWKLMHEQGNVGCSSGFLKYIVMWFVHRNWTCFCADHDFDYRYGWKYGVSRDKADEYLYLGVEASGHEKIARAIYKAVRLIGWMFYKKGEN